MKHAARTLLRVFVPAALLLSAISPAAAEVTRVEVKTRADVGSSGYEKIVGTIHFAVDPRNPRNRVIVDLDKAPVNAAGRVEFSADLYILRPKDRTRSNGMALVDVVNRGRKTILTSFNRGGTPDPATEADLGDGFLMKRGFTLVWVGWQFDVDRANGLMGIQVPAASGVTGMVKAQFVPNDKKPEQSVGGLAGYTPADPVAADSTLTVRDGPYGKPSTIARNRWQLEGSDRVKLAGGFEPGRTYEVSYRASKLPVAGLGFAAFRDVASWLKHAPDAQVHAQYAIAFGSSQSGRFLRTFLYYGFNTDERGAQALDGLMAHIAGASRLSLNERGAAPNTLGMWTATGFPFTNAALRDPISGRTEGLLDNDRARQNQPKMFFTNTSIEYWGGGRAAALIHTTPDGSRDVPIPENTRIYFLTGAQHSPARFPTSVANGQQPDNPLEYAWTLRALLVAMENWVRSGTPPPASQYPRIEGHTLVAVDRLEFPAIAGVQSPRTISSARQGGQGLPLLVPAVDDDGNEISGVRTAEIAVPTATYTGWNFRNPRVGGAKQLFSLLGSAIPFPLTKAEREAAHDPRRSIEERYPSRDRYLATARQVSERLVKGGYLLADDLPQVMKRMEAHWTAIQRQSGLQSGHQEATGRVTAPKREP
jgi:Alpha/beta hydrolase domain